MRENPSIEETKKPFFVSKTFRMESIGRMASSTQRDSLDDDEDPDDDDASDGDADASDDADDEPWTRTLCGADDDARGGDVRSALDVHKGDTLRRRGLGEGGCGGNGDERGHRAHGNGAKKADERCVVQFVRDDSIASVRVRGASDGRPMGARLDDLMSGVEGLGRARRAGRTTRGWIIPSVPNE